MPAPDLLGIFIAPLERAGLVYAITGSVASILYAEPRLTVDVDVVLTLPTDSSASLRALFPSPDFYCPPEEVIRAETSRTERGHVNVIHVPTALKADLYFSGQDPLHRWALSDRRRFSTDSGAVWVAPPEYVILRKMMFFREGGSSKHLRDIRSLLALRGAEINHPALESRVAEYGLGDIWISVTRPC